jgi:hypothetical protein
MEYAGLLNTYAEIRAAQLGCTDFTLKYRAIKFRASQKKEIQTGNDIFLLVRADTMVKVESDAGTYSRENADVEEDMIEHHGQIRLSAAVDLPPEVILKVEFWQMTPESCAIRPQRPPTGSVETVNRP